MPMATASPRNFFHRLVFSVALGAGLGGSACGRYYDEAPNPLTPPTPPRAAEAPKRPPFVLGATVPKDVDDAAWELFLLCDANDAKACTDLGRLFASKQWNATNDAKAAEFYGRACHVGDGGGCENLAEALVYGRGVPKDVAKGLALHERACQAHQVFSCSVIGAIYAAGYGVPRDLSRARAHLERACEDGDSPSCELGSPLQACAGGDASGCEELDALKARFEAK
jgi:uncharacterized protein